MSPIIFFRKSFVLLKSNICNTVLTRCYEIFKKNESNSESNKLIKHCLYRFWLQLEVYSCGAYWNRHNAFFTRRQPVKVLNICTFERMSEFKIILRVWVDYGAIVFHFGY